MDRYFTHLCEHCRAQTAAMVRTFGHASGRDVWTAQQAAYAAADGYAYRLVAAAGCPCCGQLQPNALAMYENAAKRAARRRAIGLPLAIGLALVVAILIGIPAVRDRHESLLLFAVASSVATAAFGLVLGIAWSRVPTPLDNPFGVWFSHDPQQGPGAWFPARPGPSPMIVQPNGLMRGLSLAVMAPAAIAAIVAFCFWADTFRKVHVVNTSRRGDVIVSVDGHEVGRVSPHATGDAPFEAFELRTKTKHHVVVKDPEAGERAFDLDPDAVSHGWILAPRARARGLCVTSITWYYGTDPKNSTDDKVMNDPLPGEIVELQRSFDYLFVPPPTTISTKSSSETRSTLRGFDCDDLDRDKMTPWSTVAR
jgi:hypothetical protein